LVASPVRYSCSAPAPLALNLPAHGLLPCTHTRLRNRAESATDRTLSLASADALVQIRSDLRLRFAAFPPARFAITALPPSRGPRPACTRVVPSVAFSSTASGVLYARLYCSRANPPATVALQLLPHRARPSCTSTRSRPELAQRGHRHALYVTALHVVALHIVVLHSSSSSHASSAINLLQPGRTICDPLISFARFFPRLARRGEAIRRTA
jgi:hypothetical protein